jgi:hypothetical protein
MPKSIPWGLAILVAGGTLKAAPAAERQPLKPYYAASGKRSAVIDYAEDADGYRVIVTFAADQPDTGASMRSVAPLHVCPGGRLWQSTL